MEQYITNNNINDIFLVIGHPDDEIMFFNQVILDINNTNNLKQIHIICLTNKNTIRHNELVKSCEQLLNKQRNILKVSCYDFIDSMTATWNPKDIITTLNEHIPEQRSNTMIITFDEHGISNHLNHRSCFQICKQNFQDAHTKSSLITTATNNGFMWLILCAPATNHKWFGLDGCGGSPTVLSGHAPCRKLPNQKIQH